METRARQFSARDDVLYRKAGEEASIAISQNFEAEGRPKWRVRKYRYPWPILWKTGRMRARAERTALEWIHSAREHVNRIFAPFYGYIHQYIGIKTNRRMVKRPFVTFLQANIDKMKDFFRKAFLRP
ncbi:hypothetical protein GF380_06450 [Candidatus Uhrbacteria bacterium]|nr:hypothetical protein [Candidatus Uhrbacteria bacterium]